MLCWSLLEGVVVLVSPKVHLGKHQPDACLWHTGAVICFHGEEESHSNTLMFQTGSLLEDTAFKLVLLCSAFFFNIFSPGFHALITNVGYATKIGILICISLQP